MCLLQHRVSTTKEQHHREALRAWLWQTISKIASETILNMEIRLQRRLSFLPSQSLPALRDCVIDQCHQNQGARTFGNCYHFTDCFQGISGLGRERQADSLLSLKPLSFALASSLAAKRLQPGCPAAATWHRFGLCSCTIGTWWQNQIQVSVIARTAEVACPRFLVFLRIWHLLPPPQLAPVTCSLGSNFFPLTAHHRPDRRGA